MMRLWTRTIRRRQTKGKQSALLWLLLSWSSIKCLRVSFHYPHRTDCVHQKGLLVRTKTHIPLHPSFYRNYIYINESGSGKNLTQGSLPRVIARPNPSPYARTLFGYSLADFAIRSRTDGVPMNAAREVEKYKETEVTKWMDINFHHSVSTTYINLHDPI